MAVFLVNCDLQNPDKDFDALFTTLTSLDMQLSVLQGYLEYLNLNYPQDVYVQQFINTYKDIYNTYKDLYDIFEPLIKAYMSGQDYQALHWAIQSLDSYYHCSDSTWLIQTDFSKRSVYDMLSPCIYDGDHLMIIQVTKNYNGLFPKEAVEWLKKAQF